MTSHTGEKLFSYVICESTLLQFSHFKTHMLSPTEEKPFTCEGCGSAFSQKYHLESHITSHTGEKKIFMNFVDLHLEKVLI